MKENIVTFQVAKLAKEKGFNLRVTSYYSGLNIYLDEVRLNYNDKTIGDSPMHKRNAGCYSAPTQSLLQRWLREVHNIDIFIWKNSIDGSYRVDDILLNNEELTNLEFEVGFDNYEEALEEGLYEALKLI